MALKERTNTHTVPTYKNSVPVVSFEISRYDQPKTLGELVRRRRFENDLAAKELTKLISVTEDTILNWETGRTHPCQKHILLLKEHLKIDPFELIEFKGAISDRQNSIVDLITERGSITRAECQELLGVRKKYAQDDLFFLYKLGVLLFWILLVFSGILVYFRIFRDIQRHIYGTRVIFLTNLRPEILS